MNTGSERIEGRQTESGCARPDLAVCLLACLCCCSCGQIEVAGGTLTEASTVRLTKLYELRNETVFAYARVSGDGRFLVFSYERDGDPRFVERDRLMLRVYDVMNQVVLYEVPGFDGYWSPDGRRLIYKARDGEKYRATVWDRTTGKTQVDVLPAELGDYYSWGRGDGVDTILTIKGWFVTLDRDGHPDTPRRMPECPDLGRGMRPLLSRDAARVSVFVGDQLVVRSLRDCSQISYTGMTGAKADWSLDGRYLAFHTIKPDRVGYEVGVADLRARTYRRAANLPGSSFFPSWTDDNGLVFRYDGPDYRGFMRADGVLENATVAHPVATGAANHAGINQDWRGTLPAKHRVAVLVWGAWGAHSAEALREFGAAKRAACSVNTDCEFVAAYDPTSTARDVARLSASTATMLPFTAAPWAGLRSAGAVNQNPSYLLFEDGCLIHRSLGVMSRDEIAVWFHQHVRTSCEDE